MDLQTLGILILLLPLGGAIVAAVLGPKLRSVIHWAVIAGVGGAAVCSFMVLGQVYRQDPAEHGRTHRVYEWISSGAPAGGEAQGWFGIDLRIDPLTAVMLVTVTVVSTLVVIYSRDYMREHGHLEHGYERFFAFLGLFVFAMCALVLSGNFLLLYLGWEAVGLCSYLLIGFHYQRPAAAEAAKKAFLVNRIGDFGFGLGILLIYLKCGTLDYAAVLSPEGVARLGDSATAVALLLFCGAVGKSAQIPLYVWLPDAMEGPTPVSALIHAATMVTAGVYMVARCGAIFAASPLAMDVVAWIGGATALFAATIAVAQYDMKRILAYSTISQLGYMFLALGVYAADAAVFHLFTHAFFKALLFLGAGSVMHAMAGVIDVRQFSGLWRIMPATCVTFVIGSLALAGVPLTAGFYSKDMIVAHALEVRPVLGVLALITAGLTAFYTFRMVFLAFAGPTRVPQGVHAHESGPWMLLPLGILGAGALATGWVFHERLPEFLGGVLSPFASHAAHGEGLHLSHAAVAIISSAVAVGGIALAFVLYVAAPSLAASIKSAAGGAFSLLHNKYYVDEANDAVVVGPLHRLARLLEMIDRIVVDGLVWLVSAVPRLAGFVLRTFQQGALQGYGLGMVAGVGVLLLLAMYYGR